MLKQQPCGDTLPFNFCLGETAVVDKAITAGWAALLENSRVNMMRFTQI